MPSKRNATAQPNTPSTPARPAAHTPSASLSTKSTPSKKVSAASSSSSSSSSSSPQEIVSEIWRKYQTSTPQRVKLIDAFMGFLILVGGLQFVYCVLVGNYPFNAFLSGFSATVGQFVLTASLRIQTNPENADEFQSVSHERAFADFILGSLILHFFCVNFIN